MPQDVLQQAKENYADAMEAVREQHERFREDLRFSNPSAPEQWDKYAQDMRKGRPMLTLDRTNQFISQIVNEARQNKPSIQVLPADSRADIEVAKRLNGIIRHIEYKSRAGIAYDTALELAARVGQGWIRVIPKVTNAETNEQEICITRVHDPMSICLDPNSTEPDGSDSMFGFAESTYTDKAFKAAYPKAQRGSWDSEGWFAQDGIRVAEYFKIVEESQNRIAIEAPDGGTMTVSEDEYWAIAKQAGFKPKVQSTFSAKTRRVKWCKLTGAEVLEETEFPAQWVPLIPVLGYELWIDGKRHLCGMVRRMMDGQRLHNYEASAQTEAYMMQPKAPFLLPARAVDGHEAEWNRLNTGNPAYLPYNDLDPENPQAPQINPPIRLAPPSLPPSFVNGQTRGAQEMESAVGMNRSSLGMPSNAVSGRAKLADRAEADTANFHYSDNLRRSMEHMGRIVVDMIPKIYDTRRQAKIMGEDGAQTAVEIDPSGPAVQKQGNKVVAINPGVGAYDVRVKVGPSFTTMREETSQRLVELGQGNPPLAAALAPLLVKMSELPEADKVAKVAIAMLPPNVQQAYSEDENEDVPPAVQAKMQAQGQQMQQMAAAMDQAASVIQDLQQQLNEKNTEIQAKAAVEQAKLQNTKTQLDAKAADIQAAEQMLTMSAELARAKLELEKRNALDEVRSMQEQEPEAEDDQVNESIAKLAEVILQAQQQMQQGQQRIAEAVQASAETMTQLQSVTLNALKEIDAAVAQASAPRKIVLQRDASGKPIGATSVPITENQ